MLKKTAKTMMAACVLGMLGLAGCATTPPESDHPAYEQNVNGRVPSAYDDEKISRPTNYANPRRGSFVQ
ncbi:MAG TPA: hypothetical protein VF412_02420 [Bdellovibrio sp.]|uniref:hypothetical protein n=1 Tax=Bdellovibrio sp. TaxID=28201 RepID=UPI002F163EAD